MLFVRVFIKKHLSLISATTNMQMRHMVHSCVVNPQFFILFLSKPLNLRKRKICNFSSQFQYISTKKVKRKCHFIF